MSTSITTINGSDLITNSRADINNNFASLNTNKIETSVLDTDSTLAANSDAKVASQKAVKAYVDGGGDTSITNYKVPTGGVILYGGSTVPNANWLLCDGSAVSRSTYSALFAILSTSYGTGNGTTTFNVPDLRSRLPLGYGTGTKVLTFSSRSTDTLTVTGSTNSTTNEVQDGQAVTYHTSGSVMTGLTNDTVYYLIRVAYNQFKVASTLANAVAGTQVSLSSDGTGTQTFTYTLTARTMGETGGEETHALTTAQLPSHTHTVGVTRNSANDGSTIQGSGHNTTDANVASNSAGSSTAHNIMSSFVVLNYIIKT